MDREPTPSDYASAARPYWRRAAIAVLLGTTLCAAVAFLWPPVFRAQTVLLPPSEEDTGFSVSTVLRSLNVPGIQIPSRTGPEDVTMAILRSRRVASALVQRFDLVRAYRVKREEAAIGALAAHSDFKLGESGTIVIRVEDRDPKRAADLANGYAEELDRYNREFRMTKGRRTRIFVEQRLKKTEEDLAKAEDALRAYGERHHAVALSADQLSAVESSARLFANQATLEVRLGVAREVASDSSAEVRRLRLELDQVNRLIAGLPDLGLELARLLRTVKVQEQVFALLSAQYEEARIDEARDVRTVEVLDEAVPPDRRAWPRRGLLIVLGFGLSTFVALTWVGWNVRRSREA
ncbi:MAG: GumC family protein [Hyphomicrobiales bacterium]